MTKEQALRATELLIEWQEESKTWLFRRREVRDRFLAVVESGDPAMWEALKAELYLLRDHLGWEKLSSGNITLRSKMKDWDELKCVWG